MIGVTDGNRVYIGEAADRVNRRVDTLRKLDAQGVLPRELRPRRDNGRRRYWLESQMNGLLNWFANRKPGSALAGYDPDPERLALHLERMRQPRS